MLGNLVRGWGVTLGSPCHPVTLTEQEFLLSKQEEALMGGPGSFSFPRGLRSREGGSQQELIPPFCNGGARLCCGTKPQGAWACDPFPSLCAPLQEGGGGLFLRAPPKGRAGGANFGDSSELVSKSKWDRGWRDRCPWHKVQARSLPGARGRSPRPPCRPDPSLPLQVPQRPLGSGRKWQAGSPGTHLGLLVTSLPPLPPNQLVLPGATFRLCPFSA